MEPRHGIAPAGPPHPSTTVGVSIGVPEPWASRVRDARRGYGDPLADAIETHVTLVPPTALAPDGFAAMRGRLRDVAARTAPFELTVAGTESFRPVSPVVYLRVVGGADACAHLAAALRTGPLGAPAAFPYHPHVTLAHGVADTELDRAEAEMAGTSFCFPVREFQLSVQSSDGVWSQVEGFLLRG